MMEMRHPTQLKQLLLVLVCQILIVLNRMLFYETGWKAVQIQVKLAVIFWPC